MKALQEQESDEITQLKLIAERWLFPDYDAQLELAKRYEENYHKGIDVKKNEQAALKYYLLSNDHFYTRAFSLNKLGEIYEHGLFSEEIDFNKAEDYYTEALEKDFELTCLNYVRIIYKRYYTRIKRILENNPRSHYNKNEEIQIAKLISALDILKIVTLKENPKPEAQYYLALFKVGISGLIKSDSTEALNNLTNAANQKYLLALRALGNAYLTEKYGLKKCVKTAREWYQKAASQGDLDSQRIIYTLQHIDLMNTAKESKEEVKEQKEKAEQSAVITQVVTEDILNIDIQALIKNAESGNIDACIRYGKVILYNPYFQNSHTDQLRAFNYLSAVAVTEHALQAQAQYLLHLLYQSGLWKEGFRQYQSEPLAVFWLKKSALNGYNFAKIELAEAYQEGKYGLNRNIIKAAEWYERAGRKYCEYALLLLEHAEELGKDPQEGMALLKQLAEEGDRNANEKLLALKRIEAERIRAIQQKEKDELFDSLYNEPLELPEPMKPMKPMIKPIKKVRFKKHPQIIHHFSLRASNPEPFPPKTALTILNTLKELNASAPKT